MHSSYSAALADNSVFLLQNTGITAFYAGFPLIASMLVLGIFMLLVAARGKRFPKTTSQRVTRVAGALVIAGLVGIFGGRTLANSYWAESFRNAGYAECSGGFSITKRWFTVVWTKEQDLCTDKNVRRMFLSSEYQLDDISAQVVERKRSSALAK